MNTENTTEIWDSVLQLPADKTPLQNLDIDPENLKYYLTHEEYNKLLKAVQSLINEYIKGIGSIIDPENPNNTYTILKRGDTREATDNNLFTALRVLDELEDLEDRLINGDPDDPNGVGLGDRYLSKVTHDKAAGIITFLQGIKFQPTQEDANLNTGGAIKSFGINQYGIGHLRGLALDEWLEVPELRFNRVEVNVGDFWRAAGGGKIESVEIDSVDTGIITLKVEEGEMGAISESDLCLGIYHFLGDGETPAPENSEVEIEDGKGNRAVKGFASIYFTITEILTETLVDGVMVPVPANTKFRYKLRPTNSTTFFTQHHPQPFMNFVAYGNSDDNKKHRQNSSYQTKRYERFLVNVNDWEYGDANIAAQFGDLSNISHIVGEHEGYSVYLSNVYFSGNLQQLESTTITPVLSNPNVPIKVVEGVKNLDNTSTNLQVYEGSKELKYLPGSSVDLTEGTYSVTINTIAINHGSLIDSGTYLYVGVANDMRRDSATIIFNITGKRVNGTSFKTAIHQNLYVIDFGADGQDGTKTKRIYTRTKEQLTPDIPTDANLEVNSPIKWTEAPIGPDSEYRYEWVSEKESSSPGVWSNYTFPALWANYAYDGSDGKDGKSVEFVYNRSNDAAIPPELIDVEDRTLDENYPGGTSDLGETWTDNPRGVEPTRSIEWVSKRVKVGVLQEGTEEDPKYTYLWGDYSEPKIWAKYSFDGKPGEQGSGIQVKGSFDSWTDLSTVVEPALGDGYLISGDLWIYDGVTPAVEGVNPFGWNNVGKISGESAYFHIAYADSVVFSGETPISISGFSSEDYAHKAWLGTYADHNENSALEEEWLKYKWTHIKGNDGPGQEFVYKLMDRVPTPYEPIPVKAIDDNSDDNTPTGWTDNPTGHTPLLPYEWVSIRKKKDGIWGPYTRPVVWTNYAKPGDPGAPGIAGPEGPSIVFRGLYSGTDTYYATAIRRDVVKDGSTYYITKKNLNASFTNQPVSNTFYWDSFGANFDSVATNLLLAEEANIAGFSYLGQKMVSQNGYVGSSPSTNPSDSGFIPNLSLDGITGTIHARQGSIGGFELTKNYLQSTETGTGGNKNLILNGITGKLTANDATIKGHIDAISGTFAGSLSAATGTFGGSLSAATGTFAGSLSAATGTFAGELTAATGTFAGELTAATGTFTTNNSGNRLVIDSDDHSIKGINNSGELGLSIAFDEYGKSFMELFSYTAGIIDQSVEVSTNVIKISRNPYSNGNAFITPGVIEIYKSASPFPASFTINVDTAPILSIVAVGLPTSPTGLQTGQLYRDTNGFLKVV